MADRIPNPDALYRAIEEDHRLEATADGAQAALSLHRWHWTQDESNLDRVSIPAFAKRLGRSTSIVARSSNGYRDWLAGQHELVPPSLSDCLAMAGVEEEQAEAIRAVAAATGLSPKSIVSRENQLVRNVREDAERRAVQRKTSVSEELAHSARIAAAVRKADANNRQAHRATKSHRLLVAEGRMATVMRVLRQLLAETETTDYEGEEAEYLVSLLNQARALLGLVEVKVTGQDSDTDWDAELASLGGER